MTFRPTSHFRWRNFRVFSPYGPAGRWTEVVYVLTQLFIGPRGARRWRDV